MKWCIVALRAGKLVGVLRDDKDLSDSWTLSFSKVRWFSSLTDAEEYIDQMRKPAVRDFRPESMNIAPDLSVEVTAASSGDLDRWMIEKDLQE